MDIKGKSVMILGGGGMVGRAVAFALLCHDPAKLMLTSLRKEEAQEAAKQLLPHCKRTKILTEWGDIFVRDEYCHTPREEVHADAAMRQNLIADIFDDLSPELLESTAIYRLFCEHRPEIVIDCLNTATAVAYQNPYEKIDRVRQAIKQNRIDDKFVFEVEEAILSQAVPQLIRHLQVMIESMKTAKTEFYLKIGTTGTGGMGYNIPYTHSEAKPSRLLMGKSSIAGAHTMMLFLLGRTPDAPIVKEIKPSTAIAWKKIGHGKIKRKGKFIPVYDQDPDDPLLLEGELHQVGCTNCKRQKDEYLESVYLDAGENGYFSMGEFAVITSVDQMEFVTPEEIAEIAIMEIKGGNTGNEIVSALDSSVLRPSYRAAQIREKALKKMLDLQREKMDDSVAFEMLGPPRLTKLLYEGYLIRRICGNLSAATHRSAQELSMAALALIKKDRKLRQTILSIGTPILLPDGKSYLRGPEISGMDFCGKPSLKVTPERIEVWSENHWLDLRVASFDKWIKRIETLLNQMNQVDESQSSSAYYHRKKYELEGDELDISRAVGWIFENEDGGYRMK